MKQESNANIYNLRIAKYMMTKFEERITIFEYSGAILR